MDDLPLSKLPDGDPRNHLSEAARRRVLRATLNAERIQWEAEADVESKKLSDDKARIVISKSNLKAARFALRVLWEEYSKVNLAIREFWGAMSLEIEGISNSYQLTGIQRRLLQVEFHAPPEQKNPPTQNIVPAPIALKKSEPIAKQIDRLREESRLTIEEVAEALDLAPRSIYRHLSGQANPRSRQIAAYEDLFSKRLKR